MANTLTDLMQTEILPMALPVLREQSVAARLVNRDIQNNTPVRHKETIRVPLPQAMTAGDFDPATGGTSTDLDDEKVDVTMGTWKYAQFQMDDKEMEETVVAGVLPSAVESAVKAIANAADTAVLELFKDIPYYVGTPGSAVNALATLSAARKQLNVNLAPTGDRYGLVGSDAESEIGDIDNIVKVNESGLNLALREGQIGRVKGFDWFLDQNIGDFTQSTITALQVNGAVSAGALTMDVDTGTPTTGTLNIGDLFTVAGVDGSFVVTNDNTLSGGAKTGVTFFPAAPAGGFADNAAITVIRDAANTTYINNLAFHRDAFTIVNRPIAGGTVSESSSVSQVTDEVSGLSLRMETWRDANKATRYWRLDALFGVKTLRKELAVRVLR